MYLTRKLKLKSTSQLQSLIGECASLYNHTLVFFWRTVRKKNVWLSNYSMQKLFLSNKIHAHTADACVDYFYNALKSWRNLRKQGHFSRPPKKRQQTIPIFYKSSAIRLKDGNLILSNGRNNQPIVIDNWKHDLPKTVQIVKQEENFYACFTYSVEENKPIEKGTIEAIDLGEIHPIACSNGIICNGRKMRSKKRYREKLKASFQRKMKQCKKGSRRYKKLNSAKQSRLRRIGNQIKDILHKYTTGIVKTLINQGVKTLVVGDLVGYREGLDYGRKSNQKLHQWEFSAVTQMLEYKSKLDGLECVKTSEEYTSQTCPVCGNRKKVRGRTYKCSCGFEGHRDLVGATNIKRKYAEEKSSLLVGDMTPPSKIKGIRYRPNLRVACGFI